MDRFIVAEISRNWPESTTELLAQQFERIINTNVARGYQLVDWRLSRVYEGVGINETIVAVFELRDVAEAK